MRIAFVHDYLNQFGGAERVLQNLCELFPRAPIYTLFYDEKATQGVFRGKTIRTSFLQKIPFVARYHRFFPLFMPMAIEQFDFSDYDVVFSVAASFAKGIITKPSTKHICYCLTPPRFLWDDSQKFIEEFRFPWLIKKVIPLLASYLRIWDREASFRVDEFVAISNFIKGRIKKYYLKDAKVLYPPVDVARFVLNAGLREEYYLMVGRMVTYKRFDLGVRAFNKLGARLLVVGSGMEFKNLKKIAQPNIRFLGQVTDEELAKLYRGAKGLIFPQEEDFGIVPLEAMASGCPVIAYRGGGAGETVIDGKTGVLFDKQSEDSITEAVARFESLKFDPAVCRQQAEKFSSDIFKENILRTLKV